MGAGLLAIGPTLQAPAFADRVGHGLDWWVFSWKPSYREVHRADLRSVDDLADIVYDSGVQLGASARGWRELAAQSV